MGKYIAGDDLKGWADYAKGNSYRPDKARLRHDVGTEGCGEDIKEGMPDLPSQRREEGRGWANMSPLRRITPIPARVAVLAAMGHTSEIDVVRQDAPVARAARDLSWLR